MLYQFDLDILHLLVRLLLPYVRMDAVCHSPPRFVRGRMEVEGDLFWFPLFAEGEKGNQKTEKVPLCPLRLRSEPALSVVEGVNSGENLLVMDDRVPRVHDTHMRNGHVETVLFTRHTHLD